MGKSNQRDRVLLRGVVFPQGGVWVARCFEVDHAAQAATPQSAIKECVEGVLADIEFALEHKTLGHLKPIPLDEMLELCADSEFYRQRRVHLPVPSPDGGVSHTPGVAEFNRAYATAT